MLNNNSPLACCRGSLS